MSPIQKLGTAACLLVMIYLVATPPAKVVVDNKGNVSGVQNEVREALQGDRFWRDQLAAARRELHELRTKPSREAAILRESFEADQKLRQFEEERYRKFPSERPSPAEQEVEDLRARAD